jgi:hypothetical protein
MRPGPAGRGATGSPRGRPGSRPVPPSPHPAWPPTRPGPHPVWRPTRSGAAPVPAPGHPHPRRMGRQLPADPVDAPLMALARTPARRIPAGHHRALSPPTTALAPPRAQGHSLIWVAGTQMHHVSYPDQGKAGGAGWRTSGRGCRRGARRVAAARHGAGGVSAGGAACRGGRGMGPAACRRGRGVSAGGAAWGRRRVGGGARAKGARAGAGGCPAGSDGVTAFRNAQLRGAGGRRMITRSG